MVEGEKLHWEQFGQRLRIARLRKKLTQAKFAEMVGLTQQSVTQLETGKYPPKLKSLIEICNFLELTPDQLLGFDRPERSMPSVERELLIKDVKAMPEGWIAAIHSLVKKILGT